MQNTKIGFIGGGQIARCIIGGLLSNAWLAQNIRVSDPNADKLAKLKEQFGIHADFDNSKLVQESDMIVIAVKPQQVQSALASLNLESEHQLDKKLMISLVAGIRLENIQRWLNKNLAIVRAMPNTPALLGASATALYANLKVSEEQKNLAESVLRSVGLALWVKHEHELDTVTALSGAGPAYFFLFMEAMAQAASHLGLREEDATILIQQTALGAAKMSMESDNSLAQLIQQVASKGGVTEKGLEVLEQANLRKILKKTLEAAKQRAVEIGDLFSQQEQKIQ
ncbi:MAG: pyrroline-5-carboxylate reductase [Gammaproteobacteria bacterium]